MLIITAPAKTLDLNSEYCCFEQSQPQFLAEAVKVHSALAKQSLSVLQKTLHVSENIAEENFERFKVWRAKHTNKNSRPAILTFKGDIYKEMHPHTYTSKQQKYAQKSIRILSGFYGVLRAYDLIQPYRLEMKTKLKVQKSKNLYEFWKNELTKNFELDIKQNDHQYLLNLASDEYSKALELSTLSCEIVKVDFKDKMDGKLKIVPIYAKKARGMMMEYCIRNLVDKPQGLKDFAVDGYKFKEDDKRGTLLFVR